MKMDSLTLEMPEHFFRLNKIVNQKFWNMENLAFQFLESNNKPTN